MHHHSYLPVSSISPRGNLTGNFPKSQSKANTCCYTCDRDRFREADGSHPAPGTTALFPQPTVARGSGTLRRSATVSGGDKHLSPGSRGCGGAPGCSGGEGSTGPWPPFALAPRDSGLTCWAGRGSGGAGGHERTASRPPAHQLPGGSAPFREARCARPPTSRHSSRRRAHVGSESARAGEGGEMGLRGAGPAG